MIEPLLGANDRGSVGLFVREVGPDVVGTYNELRLATGYTTTNIVSNIDRWLEFEDNGQVCYVAKQPLNGNITWNGLNELGLVYGRTVQLRGKIFKVRLMRGFNTDPGDISEDAYASPLTRISEWDRFFYPIINDSTLIPKDMSDPRAPYKQDEFLGMTGSRYETICMETRTSDSSQTLYRGYYDVTYIAFRIGKSRGDGYDTWRPLLELVDFQTFMVTDSLLEAGMYYNNTVLLKFNPIISTNYDVTIHVKGKGELPDVELTGTMTSQQLTFPLDIDYMGCELQVTYHASDGPITSNTLLIGNMLIPGPSDLTKGNLNDGYYGPTSSSELITGTELLSLVPSFAGTVQSQNEDWLKFSIDGKVLFVYKHNLKYNVSWNDINGAGLVNGSRIITIKGLRYRVRILKGLGPSYSNQAFSGTFNAASSWTARSEWDRTLLRVHISNGSWGSFSNADLNTASGQGTVSWTSDIIRNSTSTYTRMGRGYYGIDRVYCQAPAYKTNNFGYRPVLELIE